MLNDYSYIDDPSHADDSRWVNRPTYPADMYAMRYNTTTTPGRIFAGIVHLIQLGKNTPEFAGGHAVGFYTGNKQVLGYQRMSSQGTVLCLVNFSDHPEWVGRDRFMARPEEVKELITGNMINVRSKGLQLRPYQYAWLIS